VIKINRRRQIKFESLNEFNFLQSLDLLLSQMYAKPLHIDRGLLFLETYLEQLGKTDFSHPKEGDVTGIIRHEPGKICMPFGIKLPIYELWLDMMGNGVRNKGIMTIGSADYFTLEAITQEDLAKAGFKSVDEILSKFQLNSQNVAPDEFFSLYNFAGYNPKPSKREFRKLEKISKTFNYSLS
jgi:hypothetical protein